MNKDRDELHIDEAQHDEQSGHIPSLAPHNNNIHLKRQEKLQEKIATVTEK